MTQKPNQKKPKKPRKDFPLFAHNCGQWAKKVRGRIHYFGVWSDPDEAERVWRLQEAELRRGSEPRVFGTADLRELCNAFLNSKHLALETSEISKAHFNDLKKAVFFVLDELGEKTLIDEVGPYDFRKLKSKLADKHKSPTSLRREMANIRSMFLFAERNELTEKRIRFGDEFKPPGSKQVRLWKNKQNADHGERRFTQKQIEELLGLAGVQMKAMVLLAINCGLGNSDIKRLKFANLAADGWLVYPRPKTGADRTSWLWPETRIAVDKYLRRRQEPLEAENKTLVFITKYGRPWGNEDASSCPISHQFKKLTVKAQVYRKGLSFYALRHTYRTVADETLDQPAVDLTMGHAAHDMASVYREGISQDRLMKVSQFVRSWVFAETQNQ